MRATHDRLLVLIPAHNEAASLPVVIVEVRAALPACEVLVVDDGSEDGSGRLAEALGARVLRIHERIGVGGAVRTGLRYAARLGHTLVVRVDGDGQHRAADIAALLEPILTGQADVSFGSRFARAGSGASFRRKTLARCVSVLTGRRVTDPTSGFCAFGPRAIRLLSDHHPTGYGEAELMLFVGRNGLEVAEVPVADRARFAGRTTLTPWRRFGAIARIVLALVIVPLRGEVQRPAA
jgi:glycosyltransferase involved in cell wall biosynthesis